MAHETKAELLLRAEQWCDLTVRCWSPGDGKTRYTSWGDGHAYRFYFQNGYGASVVRHAGSYGADEGLWELAVLDDSHKLTYNTPITNDVIGWLDVSEVNTHLDRIAELEKGAY